ncbi:acyl-CoA dehydrogenase family protein [Conexibacter sp. SYSU D00693]|uniref:acyl-CoA dehydrogenase family protein n=1 Tax=Conexibacter sp. SYSU D00693 TaxID=2812560 RepID=UPI00196AF0D3|nr:acyl-CoA dehydrogenase family protein [Conexibacter sp. SYSU D00693]
MRLSDEQQAFAEAIRDFCERECGSREQRDALTDGGLEAHSRELYAKVAALGWLGVSIPEAYGGSGGTLVDQCLFFEEVYRGMAPIAGAGSSSTVAGVYKRFGDEEQRARVLGAIVDGDVMSISISEPGAGSDVGAVACRAARDGDRFVINGQKTWCSYAQYATHVLLLARTSRDGRPQDGLTLFEVPADAEGLEVRPIDTMGGREVNDLFLTDVEVPANAVVGEEGAGFKQIMAGLDGERLVAAAQGLGMAERALSDLLSYVQERRQFGKPIGTFQALRHRIADLATEIECCRLLTYEVAQAVDQQRGAPLERTKLTSMAKLKVTETAKHVALEGMQMMGGYGYATEYDMERHVRNTLAPPIYAGTNEIQREIISGSLGLRA